MRKFIIIIFMLVIAIGLYPDTVKDFKDFALWLKDNFTYQAEKESEKDYWKSPKETLRDKGGDCEDLAILTMLSLRKLGYKCYFMAITRLKKEGKGTTGHAIAILKQEEGYSFFSNTRYFPTRYQTIRQLLNKNYPRWTRAQFCWINQKCYQSMYNKKNMKKVKK